jgi:uroporphyrinogen-III synthase
LPDPDTSVVLITRPLPAADETARLVAALGFTPLVAPVLETTLCPARLPTPDRVQALLLTSANAVPVLSAEFHHRPVFAVGNATAAAARAAGFTRVTSAAGNAATLAGLVARLCDPDRGSLLFPGAARLAVDIAKPLREMGFRVIRRIVYRTDPVAELAAPARLALAAGGVRVALFFSPASAQAFGALLRATLPPTCMSSVEAIAISAKVAASLAPLPWRRIRVASLPNQDEMVALLT